MTRHIALIAGEASGDFLGGRLMRALKNVHDDRVSDIRFSGVGGPQMKAEGLESLFPYEDLAVMGIAEVIPSLKKILSRIRITIDFIKREKPDIVVTIDSPDFCFRVAKAIKKEMKNPPPIIHYVAPTVWAWRENRAEKIAKFLDGLICLFDFEPPYFEKYGLKAVAVGHSLIESGALEADGKIFRSQHGIGDDDVVLGLLFGSRRGELKRVGPTLRAAAFDIARLLKKPPVLVAPTLPHLESGVRDLLEGYPGTVHVTTNFTEKWNAFASFNTAIAVSGTVGLELAAINVPHVIAYKVSASTAAMVKFLVKVRHAHLVNIMLDRDIIPEFIQGQCKPDLIAEAVFDLVQDETLRDAQINIFDIIRARLGAGQKETPSQKAAAFLFEFLR